MKFYLVSAENSDIRKEVNIPNEIVTKQNSSKITPKRIDTKKLKRNGKLSRTKQKAIVIQSSSSLIDGSAHHSNKRTTKSV